MQEECGFFARVEWPERQTECDAARRYLLGGDAGRGWKAYDALLHAIQRGHAPPPASPAGHGLLLAQAASCLTAANRPEPARKRLEEAERLARSSGDAGLLSVVLRAKASFGFFYDRRSEGLAALGQEALALLAKDPGRKAVANLRALLGFVHSARADHGAAIRERRRAILAGRSLSARSRLVLLREAAAAYSEARHDARSLRLKDLCIKIARSLDPPAAGEEAAALQLQGATLLRSGVERGRGVDALCEALRTGRSLGRPHLVFACLHMLAVFAWEAGWYSAVLRLGGSLRKLRLRGLQAGMDASLLLLTYAALGLTRRAQELAAGVRRELESRRDDAASLPALGPLRALAEAEGDLPAARELAERAVRAVRRLRVDPVPGETAHQLLVRALTALSSIELASGASERATRFLAQARQLDLRGVQPSLRAEADGVDAEIHLAAGDAGRALRLAARAWARARGRCDPPTLAGIFPTLVRALARAGKTREAATRARQGLWLLGWIVDKLDPAHRSGYLDTPGPSRLREVSRAAGVDDEPSALFKASSRPPFRYPRLEGLDGAWGLLTAAGILASEREDKAPLRARERELIEKALRDHGGSVRACAKALGIHRDTLYDKMKRLGLRPPSAGMGVDPRDYS